MRFYITALCKSYIKNLRIIKKHLIKGQKLVKFNELALCTSLATDCFHVYLPIWIESTC